MSYIEHFLSSSSLSKNKEVLIYPDGVKIEGNGSSFLESLWNLFFSLNLHLSLQLGNLIISQSYQFHVSLYFSVLVGEFSHCCHIMFLVPIKSRLPSHLLCLIIDPKWIQEGQNFKVLGIRKNQHHCVGLVRLILTIYVFPKMDVVYESYRILNFFRNKGKVKSQIQLVKDHIANVEDDLSSTS
jgi:hypothetical protein